MKYTLQWLHREFKKNDIVGIWWLKIVLENCEGLGNRVSSQPKWCHLVTNRRIIWNLFLYLPWYKDDPETILQSATFSWHAFKKSIVLIFSIFIPKNVLFIFMKCHFIWTRQKCTIPWNGRNLYLLNTLKKHVIRVLDDRLSWFSAWDMDFFRNYL